MNRMTTTRGVWLGVASLAMTALAAAAQTVPGEKWQQTMTMQMAGMSMPMPGHEVCVPVGRAAEELAKPDKACALSNVKQAGNRFSAHVKCTGKDAMEGDMDMTTTPDKVSGRMSMKSADGEMNMVMESRKLGACQAVDAAALGAAMQAQGDRMAAMAASAPKVDVCGSMLEQLKKDPKAIGGYAGMFAAPGGQCATQPANPAFCAAVQSRGGFAGLAMMEGSQAGVTAQSLAACGLGQGKAGVDAMRAKLVAAAEKDGDTDFLVAQAPAKAKELARTQCVLKGEMWAGKTSKLDRFCDSNFAEEARRSR